MATLEQLSVHVDLSKRKVMPFPDQTLKILAKLTEAHAPLPVPPEVGSVMSTKKRK
ncbi:MAG: hypothetical protein O7G83_01380 [Proteobacteria bacterium]|nr:hypothetical protein [Pseudomonadota bacterium]